MVVVVRFSAVAIVVILVVPMPLVHLPAFAVVVVMRMTPVCPFIWRTVPASPDPPVMVTNWFPISFHPDEAWTWSRPTLLIAERRWRSPNVHRNLCRTRRDNGGCEQCAIHPIQSHFVSPFLKVGRFAFFQQGQDYYSVSISRGKVTGVIDLNCRRPQTDPLGAPVDFSDRYLRQSAELNTSG